MFADASIKETVSIGDVTVELGTSHSELIPVCYEMEGFQTQDVLAILRWMMQKYSLHQDVFLIGHPGAFRRRLAFWFCEVIQKEAEYLAITSETTESDLKQRSEVINGTLSYVDQGPVRCAIEGRVLIIEGIEKAERNVLPTLNNLLENREMALADGRFLMSAEKYGYLLLPLTAVFLFSFHI